jgi:polar amino acid transport system substrate-binding protein
MKKHIVILLFISLILSYANAKDSLIVSVHPSAHPYGWHDKDKTKGAIVELMNLIGKDLGINVKPTILPWARTISDAQSGKIDAVLTMFYTKERAKYISYTRAYDHMDTSVFVKKDSNIKFNKWDDLIGLTGLTIVGDSQGDKWDKFEKEKLNVIRVVKIEQIFSMLASGRADYAIFPKISTVREIEKMGYSDKIGYLPNPVISQGIYIGISKKSPYHKYLDKINEKIKYYIDNGIFLKLRDKAFDEAEKAKK